MKIELSQRELALIFLIRRIKFGALETVSVHGGEPGVIKCGAQRIDLSKKEELEALLEPSAGVAVDLSSKPSSIAALKAQQGQA